MGCMGGDCASAVTNVCNNEKKVIFAFCKGKLGVRLVGKHPTLQDNSLLGSRTAGLLDIHPLLPRDTQRRWCFSPGGPVVKTSKSQCRWQKFNLVGELRSCMLHKAAKKLK